MDNLNEFPQDLHAALVDWANDIFKWGGVPQTFIYYDVLDVLSSVSLGVRHNNARMNSGWTKVASFASEVLDSNQHLVIWDSRVAHSIVTRFERMLLQGGIIGLPEELSGIRYVPGWRRAVDGKSRDRRTAVGRTARRGRIPGGKPRSCGPADPPPEVLPFGCRLNPGQPPDRLPWARPAA